MSIVCGGAPTRRRFIAIAAAAAGLPFAAVGARAETAHMHRWSGIALGAAAEIVLHDPDAARARWLIARCVAEIDRLEDVFSLYRPESAVSRLNRAGRLTAPPLELVALLAEARFFSERTGGAFDITVQSLWRLYAAHFARPGAHASGPGEADRARVRALVGYTAIAIDGPEVRFARPGMAVTLNGIAQGYITDRVAALLRDAGMTRVLLDIGECRALGRHPDGRPWRVGLRRAAQPETVARTVALADRAVATSAGIASPFEPSGRHHHLFDPASGRPARMAGQVSVIAPSATMADALSTALAVSPPARAAACAARFPEISVLTDAASPPPRLPSAAQLG